VLFADLVGYTDLSELRDPEQVKHLVDRCFERLVADIEVFGGRVEAQPHPQDASQVGRRACVSLTGLADVDGA
jgi:class 3 adenylate cyclase